AYEPQPSRDPPADRDRADFCNHRDSDSVAFQLDHARMGRRGPGDSLGGTRTSLCTTARAGTGAARSGLFQVPDLGLVIRSPPTVHTCFESLLSYVAGGDRVFPWRCLSLSKSTRTKTDRLTGARALDRFSCRDRLLGFDLCGNPHFLHYAFAGGKTAGRRSSRTLVGPDGALG